MITTVGPTHIIHIPIILITMAGRSAFIGAGAGMVDITAAGTAVMAEAIMVATAAVSTVAVLVEASMAEAAEALEAVAGEPTAAVAGTTKRNEFRS